MYHDRNPKYGRDLSFSEGARRTADLLWESTGGNLSAFPRSYLENLRYEFSDGNVSMLELIDRVDLGPDATYEDYCEVVDNLLKVDPGKWPNAESVQVVFPEALQYGIESDYDFSEFDFIEEEVTEEEVIEGPKGEEVRDTTVVEETGADPLSDKMELFFKKVISSVYLDGVTDVTDLEGNPPTSANNYLLSDDGKSFTGIFYDSSAGDKNFPFTISENEEGTWSIKY